MRLGIDLGGTKIEIAALDDTGEIVLRRRVPTPAGDYAATLACIADLVRESESRLPCARPLGVGIPGSLSRISGLVRNANSTVLNGRPLHTDLEALLGRPVRVANDANCFALSEAADGAGAGADSVFGVILGTGVGGGLVVRGVGLEGINGIAGEWGHNPLPSPLDDERPGPACYCGRNGCVETWLSGPGFANDHCNRWGETHSTTAIVAGMRAGEYKATITFDHYVDRMARSLATVINLFDPAVIVLGGGLSNIDELYVRVPERWERYIFSDHVATRLVRNRHGDSSGVRGAAWLWPIEAPPSAMQGEAPTRHADAVSPDA